MKKLALLLAAVLTLETLVPSLTPVSNAAELVPEVTEEQSDVTAGDLEEAVLTTEIPVVVPGTTAGEDQNIETQENENTILDSTRDIEAVQRTPQTVVKNVYKMNIFYENSSAIYQVKATENKGTVALTDVELLDSEYFDADWDGSKLQIYRKNLEFNRLTAAQQKQASKVKIQFSAEDGRTWTKDIVVAYQKIAPKLVLSQTSGSVVNFVENGTKHMLGNEITLKLRYANKTKFYGEMEEAKLVSYTDSKKNRAFSAVDLGVDAADLDTLSIYYEEEDDYSNFTFYFVGDRAATAKIQVKCAGWAEPMIFKYTMNVKNVVPKLKQSSYSALVNAYYGDEASIALFGQYVNPTSITLGEPKVVGKLPKNATYGTSELDTFTFSTYDYMLYVKTPKNENMVAGKYSFEIPVTLHFNEDVSYTLPKPIKVTITLKNQEITSKDLAIKKSGSVSLTKGGYMEYTYTLKNVNAYNINARFAQEENSFYVYPVGNNKLRVGLRNGVSDLKTGTYKTNLKLTFAVDGCEDEDEDAVFNVVVQVPVTVKR